MKENSFGKESGAYLRTTENINGYYRKLFFYGKKVLTVIGSSDQIFEAIFRGAKEVDGFDISINAILLYYLKEAAVKTMNYEEYMNFFFVENKCFTKEGYRILRPVLNEMARSFWDRVFNSQEKKPLETISDMLVDKPKLFQSYLVAEKYLSSLSSYLNRDNFFDLKRAMNNAKVNILLRDVYSVDGIKESYDYIILSNIFEYQDTEKFKELIEKYRLLLNPNGLIIVGYAYHDIDVSAYSEYDKIDVPSRAMVQGVYGAPSDHVMTTGKKR